ncbi:MAG TPA: DUF255 domain-containing protein, partial [Thermoanaerobaculia bacterium]|nr:DUF255 domain-containing protein [Thermoanaerobaculia bacterium]
MLRRLVLVLLVSLPALAASRYVSDRQGTPIQWQAWGSAALQRAVKENRPIFLSACYAAPYECDRMHRQAFLVGETAEMMNAYYVPVLLDRIEHPEIAEAYQTLLRSMTGKSGYPANFILTPSLEPFAAAGSLEAGELSRLLVVGANRWAGERAQVVAEAKANVEKARAMGERRAPSPVDDKTIEAVVDSIAARYDTAQGGFAMEGETGRRPHPMIVSFLFRYAARTKHENIRRVAIETLRKLAVAPIRDQLGGGFHRATRDTAWREPHFEKLLPDQALLSLAYIDAAQITGDSELAWIARTTLDYVARDLRNPKGGSFDAAQDAYSLVPGMGPEAVNGAFYLWTTDEIARLVGPDDAGKIFRVYGMVEGKKNLPILQDPRFLGETYDELAAPLAKMLDVRQKRPEPFREITGVAGWNGLMISAFARGAAAWDDGRFLDAARSAASAVVTKLWNAQKKTLSRTDAAAGPQVEALAEDYAYLVQGLLDLFEISYDTRWLDLAVALQQRQDALFWDASAGRYATGASLPPVLRGLLVETDDETPSINAVAAVNLMRLAALTGNAAWRARPAVIFESFGTRLRNSGADVPQLAAAYEMSLVAPQVVVVSGDPRKSETKAALRAIHERWEPMRAVVFLPLSGTARERVTRAVPFTAALASDPEQVITWVCGKGEC